MPGPGRVDLRRDRRVQIGNGANRSAFIWVQNIFDQTNTKNVWRFTGEADNDGFLATAEGIAKIANSAPAYAPLYEHRNRVQSWVGIPRLTRIGVRIDF